VEPHVFSEVRVAQSLVLCEVFCMYLFVHLSLLLWSLCFLSFFYLRLLISALVSSNSS
jgi:hypothetical protein